MKVLVQGQGRMTFIFIYFHSNIQLSPNLTFCSSFFLSSRIEYTREEVIGFCVCEIALQQISHIESINNWLYICVIPVLLTLTPMKIMIKCEQKRVFSTADCVYMCVSLCVIFSVNSWQLTQLFLIFLHSPPPPPPPPPPPLSFRSCPHCFIPHHNSTVLGVATGIPTLNGHTHKNTRFIVSWCLSLASG